MMLDVIFNFFAWLVSRLNIESSVLSNQWDNMGYTFVKFTFEELYHERKQSFIYLFSLFALLFCFVLFVGLRVDGSRTFDFVNMQ